MNSRFAMTGIVTLLGLSLPASASMKSAARSKPETYPANEPGTTLTVTATASLPTSEAAPRGSFDNVPADQTRFLLKRLQLVQELILKYNRAYDYRTLTTAELESILRSLENSIPASEMPPEDL